MVSRTRRRFLHGTAAVFLTGLAGCSESSSRSDSSTRTPPYAENVERDPESYVLRNDAETSPAWLAEDGESRATDETTAGPPEHARTRALVASEESAARLQFADVSGVEAAREFVSNTDFEAETLYVESRPVDECRSLELCHVAWSAGDIDTQYGGGYRDADVACEVDATDVTTWFIRVPDVLDPDHVSSYGSGWSSSPCGRRRRRDPEREATTTDAPDFGPATNATATGDGSAETTGDDSAETTGEDER